MRRQRSDLNQSRLVKVARKLGFSVLVISRTESIDLLVGLAGIDQLIELKNPDQAPSDRILSKDEQKFHDAWRGKTPVIIENENGLIELRMHLLQEAAK